MNSLVIGTAALLTPALLLAPVLTHAGATSGQNLIVEELPGSNRHLHDLAPGDRTEWAAQVTNTADTPTAIRILVRAAGNEALISNPVEGLQLAVDFCPTPLTTTTTPNGAATFTCERDETRIGSGPAAQLASDADALTTTSDVDPGKTVGIRVRLNLPTNAGNALEKSQGQLLVQFIAMDEPDTDNPITPGTSTDNGTDTGTGTDTDTGTGTGTDQAGGNAQWPSNSSATSNLAITGRDFMAALAGALLTTAVGLLLIAASRRRRLTTSNGEA